MGTLQKTNSTRMPNLELLRIVSMLMVIMLHLFTQGNVLQSVTGGVNYYFTWIMEAICYTSVNSYMLISGYFMWRTKFRWRRIVGLYAQILFYTIVIAGITFLIRPSLFDAVTFSKLLPVFSGNNWYISIYFVLVFLTPLLNAAIRNIKQSTHRSVMGILFLAFSLMPSVFFNADPFLVNAGYSVLWFMYVYLVAAYIGKYKIELRSAVITIMCLMLMLVPMSKFFMDLYHLISGNYEIQGTFFYTYNSAPVAVASVGVFAFFLNLKIRDERVGRFIVKVAKTTFGVFYIHTFFIYRDFIWEKMGSTKFIDSPVFIPYCFGLVLAIFIVCSIIDFLRAWLFKVTRIDKLIDKISHVIELRVRLE